MDIGTISLAVSCASLLVTAYNVNRTQTKNKQNDAEKFKRDLSLKASDEIIEAINTIHNTCNDLLAIRYAINNLDYTNESISNLITLLRNNAANQHNSTTILNTKYAQREIILKVYEARIERIFTNATDIVGQLKALEGYFGKKSGRTDTQINEVVVDIENRAAEQKKCLAELRRAVQNEFFSELFGRKV